MANAHSRRPKATDEGGEATTRPGRPAPALESLAARTAAHPEQLGRGLEAADPAARAAMVLSMQRTAGNAAVQRIVARQPAAGEGTVVAPHEGGDDKEGLSLLSQAAPMVEAAGELMGAALGPVGSLLGAGLEALLGAGPAASPQAGPAQAPPAQAPPAGAPAPVPDDLKAWHARKPATNPDYAQWLLDAETHGFIKFTSVKRSKAQLEDLRDKKKVVGADPGSTDILGGLVISHAMTAGAAQRWIADPSKPKVPFVMGDYIRQETGGHSTGERVDIGGFDWTGPKGPDQVLEALGTLPADRYGIGLPFQGEFFPRDEWFNPEAKKVVADAQAAGQKTAEIKTPLLAKGKTTRITGTWSADSKKGADWDVPAGWDVTTKGNPSAVSSLKSATLKSGLRDLKTTKAIDIYVFPDNENHLHVQQGAG